MVPLVPPCFIHTVRPSAAPYRIVPIINDALRPRRSDNRPNTSPPTTSPTPARVSTSPITDASASSCVNSPVQKESSRPEKKYMGASSRLREREV